MHQSPSFSIATWNVNSIKARMPHVLGWLNETAPDVALLQETKTTNDTFPAMEIEDLGYNIAIHGQKSYNGVAILSKYPINDIITALPGDENDAQARYIEGVIALQGVAIRVASIYVPNGQSPESEKFTYKLRFLERLQAHAATLLHYNEMLVLGGDYNVAPYPEDIFDPIKMDGTTCYHENERTRFRPLLYGGLYDAFRLKYPDTLKAFSFWDYRGNAYAQNAGYRIDHLLLSPQAADKLQSCEIQHMLREKEKASDHAPVFATFE